MRDLKGDRDEFPNLGEGGGRRQEQEADAIVYLYAEMLPRSENANRKETVSTSSTRCLALSSTLLNTHMCRRLAFQGRSSRTRCSHFGKPF